MALVRSGFMFKIYPAKVVCKQKAKLRPNEHHYEKEGEEPYIKYTCQICEQLAENMKGFQFGEDEGKFKRFSFPKGTEQCPCCGVNIDWDYK